jgi:nitrate reductase NapE component
MDGREGRCAFGFLLFGITPLLATAGGAGLGMVVFAAGLLIATSAAFA